MAWPVLGGASRIAETNQQGRANRLWASAKSNFGPREVSEDRPTSS